MKKTITTYLQRAKAQRERDTYIDGAVSQMAYEKIVIGL